MLCFCLVIRHPVCKQINCKHCVYCSHKTYAKSRIYRISWQDHSHIPKCHEWCHQCKQICIINISLCTPKQKWLRRRESRCNDIPNKLCQAPVLPQSTAACSIKRHLGGPNPALDSRAGGIRDHKKQAKHTKWKPAADSWLNVTARADRLRISDEEVGASV